MFSYYAILFDTCHVTSVAGLVIAQSTCSCEVRASRAVHPIAMFLASMHAKFDSAVVEYLRTHPRPRWSGIWTTCAGVKRSVGGAREHGCSACARRLRRKHLLALYSCGPEPVRTFRVSSSCQPSAPGTSQQQGSRATGDQRPTPASSPSHLVQRGKAHAIRDRAEELLLVLELPVENRLSEGCIPLACLCARQSQLAPLAQRDGTRARDAKLRAVRPPSASALRRHPRTPFRPSARCPLAS